MNSLVANFDMNKSTVAILNEMWFKKSDSQLRSMLNEIDLEHDVKFIRKDRGSCGRGVAIAFKTSQADFSKVSLQSLKGKKYEILVVAGKLHGEKKRHVIVSVYLPPNYSKKELSLIHI